MFQGLPRLNRISMCLALSTLLTCGIVQAQTHPAGSPEAPKMVEEGLWSKLTSAPSLKRRIIVQFSQPAMAPAASFATDEDADAALTRSVRAVQESILNHLSPHEGLAAASADEKRIKLMDFSPMFAMAATAAEVARLAEHPFVTSIVEDALAAPALNDTLPLIGMPQMYAAGFNGDGYAVAVLDSGARTTHKFLAGQIVSEACYNTDAGAPYDSSTRCPGGASSATGPGAAEDCVNFPSTEGCGHGTLVSGIAAGFNTSPLAGEPTSGVARGAGIVSINIQSLFDTTSGECPPGYTSCLRAFNSDVIRGLERVYTLRNTYNIAAVNLSQSDGASSVACNSSPLRPTIDLLRSERIATIISVGNDGNDAAVGDPSCIPAAIAVAASTNFNARAVPSNWGPLVDLVAPGESVISSYVNGSSDTTFAISSGTSLAAAHVAGAFAVLREVRPDASVTEIENALKNTGVPITSAGVTKPRIHVDDARAALQGGTDLDPAAPANNNFVDGTVVAAPGTVNGSNVGADSEPGEPMHAGTISARKTVWWRYRPNQSGTVVITTQGSAIDTVMGVYTGSAVGSLSLVAGNDDNPSSGLWSQVSFSATAGTTYHVAVAGYSSSAGSIKLNVSGGYVTPPSNDNFVDRAIVAAAGTAIGTTVGALDEAGEPVHAAAPTARRTIWWSYTAQDSGTVTIDAIGSAVDAALAVYTGSSLGALTEVAAFQHDVAGPPYPSQTFEVEQGTEYAIAAASALAEGGTIVIHLDEVPFPRPGNDDFAQRSMVAVSGSGDLVTLTGGNLHATRETGEPGHAGFADATTSVWWSYTPAASGSLLVDTLGSNFDTVLGVYSGNAVNALTQVAANDDFATISPRSRVTLAVTAGRQYQIAVAGKGGASGAIAVRLRFTAPPPPPGPTTIVAATSPVARAARVGATVTAFATILNSGANAAVDCGIAAPSGLPVAFDYRTYSGGTVGSVTSPRVTIGAGGRQDFVMSFRATAPMISNMAMVFDCTNTPAAPSVRGLNTFLMTATTGTPADVISTAVTADNSGTLTVPVGATRAAALAAINIGTAASLQARISTTAIGGTPVSLPATIRLCRTNPTTGACITGQASAVNFSLSAGQIATFTGFVTATGAIPFDPANRRLFVHFYQGSTPVGSASVALRTSAADQQAALAR